MAGSSEDESNLVLCRRRGVFAVLNRFPYINGHLMVVPERHAGLLGDLGPEEVAGLFEVLALAERALEKGMKCSGMNGGWNVGRCAGAGVEGHIHLHLLPRWPGDVNFMTPVAATRVLSESLETTYGKLKPWFEREAGE